MKKPFALGIAGGSGSGKSTLAAGINNHLDGQVKIFRLDDYFKDPAQMSICAGIANWDDPQSINYLDLVRDIGALEYSGDVQLVIVEGFLVLHYPELRSLFDFSIFLTGPRELFTERRIHPSGGNYVNDVVHPMHELYVEPSSKHANTIIDITGVDSAGLLSEVINLMPNYLKEEKSEAINLL